MTILEILQRFCALVILGPLAWLAILTKTDIIKWESSMFTCMQKNKLSLPSFLRYGKDIADLLFLQFEHAWPWPPKTKVSGCRKCSVYFHAKNQIYPSPFWNIAKTLQTYLTYFGHAWPHPPKTLVSTCRKC